MPTDEKQCANECGSGWCCHWEFFIEHAKRYPKDIIRLENLKGFKIFNHPTSPKVVIVAVPVTCSALGSDGCSLGDERPNLCKVFPTADHGNWILSKHCKYYEAAKHWAFEDLELYTPEDTNADIGS